MTTTTTPRLTAHDLKAWAQNHRALAANLIAAIAYQEVTREAVDGYIKPVFNRFAFTVDVDTRAANQGQPITNPDLLYLSTDEAQLNAFYAACDEAHMEHGYIIPPGHCPALIAKHNVFKAETALLQAARPLLSGNDPLNLHGADRDKFLQILLKLCINE